jgi:hypothetical protein
MKFLDWLKARLRPKETELKPEDLEALRPVIRDAVREGLAEGIARVLSEIPEGETRPLRQILADTQAKMELARDRLAARERKRSGGGPKPS